MATVPSRRERVRAQTIAEIKERALAQVSAGGTTALSLNAIAKAMGVSGPALYRYYASRDELLGALVADGYRELAGAVAGAAETTGRRGPEARLVAVAAAYRAWALAHPQRYTMLFGPRPAGYADSPAAIAEIQPGMEVLLGLLGELAGASADGPPPRDRLARQLRAWHEDRAGDAGVPVAVLRLGVLTWTRLHGIVGLELAGALGDMGLDAGLLVEAEMRAIVDAARSG